MGKEAIPAAVVVADVDLEDFAGIEDEIVDVLELNRLWNAEGIAYKQR